ncbi:MAG: exopolyphosphatase [Spirochaetaceae bacterium]|jgi:nanoRNase/pAp phosphatase (c-di-AMP/oligoRNAs hydrolase)|nr:exopolyphosphatase [Spirochaetaceae bacterium]
MRLLTRADFDGLACGALLEYLGIVNEWEFVHPTDVQNGFVHATENDVVANIPYIKGCKIWFDHHSSEIERLGKAFFEERKLPPDPEGSIYPGYTQWEVIKVSWNAPSCARVIYDYYREQMPEAGLERFEEMVGNVDKVDSGSLSEEEVLNPAGWVLLGFIMDPRTGLGRFGNFTITNVELVGLLAQACVNMDITQILSLCDVRERIDLYFQQDKLFREMIRRHSAVEGNVLIIDLRKVDPIYTGNRFLPYILFPDQNISVTVIESANPAQCTLAVGRSTVNKSAAVDVGSLMLAYKGGGHKNVGTCQVPRDEADRVLQDLVRACKG